MPRKYVLAALCLAGLLLCYCFGLTGVGIFGTDEPRYAAIGRAMAASGDWVTPRLWGSPWFEKPALLYWMVAAGFRSGFDQDLAPRLPVALLSVGFVLFFWWRLKREFGNRAATFSAAMLATSALWLGYSHVAVFDLPLAATFGACMLLVLAERRTLLEMSVAGALLGAAMLAKGFVPCALFLPALWRLRANWRQLAVLATSAVVVAAPWYALVIARNGMAFIDEFFWKQQFSRLSSPALMHVQPVWFYIPVMLAGFFPWTPLAVVPFAEKALFRDSRMQFLLAWLLWGFIFFSAVLNKLPGYVLPLFPALAALVGIGLASSQVRFRVLFTLCAAWVWLLPIAGQMLPAIQLRGLAGINFQGVTPLWVLPTLLSAALVCWLESRLQRVAAVGIIAGVVTVCTMLIVIADFPAIDRTASARRYWRQHSSDPAPCNSQPNRSWRYSLNYYADRNLPDCAGGLAP